MAFIDLSESNDNIQDLEIVEQPDLNSDIIPHFQNKYFVQLNDKWLQALQQFYHSINQNSSNTTTNSSVQSISISIYEKEFLYSNLYQSVVPSFHQVKYKDLLNPDQSSKIHSIHSQKDIETMDRMIVEHKLTLQIDEIQDISLPMSQVTIHEEDVEDEVDASNGNNSVETSGGVINSPSSLNTSRDHLDQLKLFRSHLDVQKKDEDEFQTYRRRMLKFSLTDGQYRFYALEYESLQTLFPSIPNPGTKFTIQNFKMRRGVILLDPKSFIQLWGGVNEDIYNLNQEKRKRRRIQSKS